MPIILHKDLPIEKFSERSTRTMIATKELGAASITVERELVEPGTEFRHHIHPTHEDVVVLVEGTVEVTIGDEVTTVEAPATIIVPRGVRHGMANRSDKWAQLIGIVPTVEPYREFV